MDGMYLGKGRYLFGESEPEARDGGEVVIGSDGLIVKPNGAGVTISWPMFEQIYASAKQRGLVK